MSTATTLPSLLSSLTDSLTSATESLTEPDKLKPPTDGISLLDTKNELLLSYLQNLVFLIILKIRDQNPNHDERADNTTSPKDLQFEVTKKLVELRLYLEKGIRPLESRLKYQIDKLLLAASDADAVAAQNKPKTTSTAPSGPPKHPPTDESDSDASSAPFPPISDLSHRPNPSALTRPSLTSPQPEPSALYRPPRITPTSLPTTTSTQNPTATKPRKSHTLSAFIREEMSDAPLAEPSIGAGNGLRGREREKEEERRGYEEQRLIRLPGERGKKGRDRRRGEDLSGGLSGLGDGLEELRVGKRKREGGGGEREGRGERIGERWEKRVKRVGRKRR
ncbi:hypothetical protein ACLMJK_007407 [Lecanora helva]